MTIKLLFVPLVVFLFASILHAAEKIRIGFREFNSSSFTLQLKRVIRAGIKGNRYILQNREGTIQVMMPWMRVDRDTATATYDGSVKSFKDDGSVSDAGLRIALDESRKATKTTREVAVSEVADFSMLREAAGVGH